MSIIKSLCSAFLMYSRIPVPQVEWREENRRYALCFFPLIGCVIGGLLLGWYWLCGRLNVGGLLFAAAAVFIPIFVTGGIHLDGFCDVCDALASCGSREKMLEIMSDPHIGSFAAIRLAMYILLQAGVLSQADSGKSTFICALCFVQSRALSGLAAVIFQNAKSEGALVNFTRPAHKAITVATEAFFLLAAWAGMIYADAVCGAAAISAGGLTLVHYRLFSYKQFGGITGDLAGYFLQICELAAMSAAVAAHIAQRVLL